jgi:hypothetical protein
VRTADNPRDFAFAIRQALTERYDPEPARARLQRESWDDKAAYLAERLVDLVYELEAGKSDERRPKLTAA